MVAGLRGLSGGELVGRERQLNQLLDAVNLAPALVTLAGDPGMGKTTLVRAFSARCQDRGWTVLARSLGEDPIVDPQVTVEQFSARLRNLLDRGTDVAATTSPAPAGQRLLPVVKRLRVRAPALLVIEDFRADLRFMRWFERRFLADVAASDARLCVLVTGRKPDLGDLVAHAARTIELGPLHRRAVRAHFVRIGSRLRHPLEPNELEAYVRSATRAPAVLASLTALLSMAERRPI
jgi:hypothetical protein